MREKICQFHFSSLFLCILALKKHGKTVIYTLTLHHQSNKLLYLKEARKVKISPNHC